MNVSWAGNEVTCSKHGKFQIDFEGGDILEPRPKECPTCKDIREKGLCVVCEDHIGTVVYAEGGLALVHGMTEKLCRCCYRNRLEANRLMLVNTLRELDEGLKKASCDGSSVAVEEKPLPYDQLPNGQMDWE